MRSAGLALLVAAPLSAVAPLVPAAHAQPLPDTGTTVQVGALRQQLEGLLASGTAPQADPGWTVVPAIGVEQRWTDHLQEQGGSGKSAFITALRPSVLVNGQTVRTTTTLSYAPELLHYSSGNQDQIAHNLNAVGQATLVPERLFLDLRGFAAMQPVNGGYGPNGTVAVARQNETQLTSFSAHPYLRQRFGELGFAELGATLSRASQDALSGNQLASASGTSTGAQTLLSQQEYFSLTSGPAFGRTSAGLSLTANQSTGGGVLRNSRRNEAVLNLGYAITRTVTALGELGYDDIHYAGTPNYSYSGARWSTGLHWTPNPDSSITVSYGRREGADSAQLDASYALTPRTRVYARYSEGLASGLEQLLNGVNGSTLDPMGNPVDRTSGAPVQLDNSFYGLQDNLARVQSASVTLALLRERDSFAATFSHQQRHQVAGTGAGTIGNQDTSGFYGSLNWQRDLRPNLNSAAFIQWGRNQGGTTNTGQSFDSLVFSLSLTYVISENLSAYGQYSWTRQTNPALAGAIPALPANLIVVGARKTF